MDDLSVDIQRRLSAVRRCGSGEFLFAYLIGRAYFLGRPALECFLGIFKIVACCVVFFALLDTLSGQQFTLKLFGAPTAAVETVLYRYRFGLVRAGSTFEGGESFGTFCVAAAAIFIFSVRNLPHRIFYAGVCLFGCFLSLSSGPLLGPFVLLGTVTYDFVLRSYKSRLEGSSRRNCLGPCALFSDIEPSHSNYHSSSNI